MDCFADLVGVLLVRVLAHSPLGEKDLGMSAGCSMEILLRTGAYDDFRY